MLLVRESQERLQASVLCDGVCICQRYQLIAIEADSSWLNRKVIFYKRVYWGTSLVAQWLGIRLQMQGTRVRALVQEDPMCCGVAEPVHHHYWACALAPVCHNYWACVVEARAPGACAPQQERPLQWEACTPWQRVSPARRNWRKLARSNKDPMQPKINK